MRKIRNAMFLSVLLILTSACQKNNESFTIYNSRGEVLRVTLLEENKMNKLQESVDEADNILQAYLGDSYKKGNLYPVTIENESGNSKYIQYGVNTNGIIYINLGWYKKNSRELVRTIVHEELHYQNPKGLNLIVLPEDKNAMISEYIVYYLTEKLCTCYDEEKYGDMYYGAAPKIPELDEYRDELSEIYLGREELSEELLKEILDWGNKA